MALSKYILESAYARILLTEGRKDIIVNKIGLPEHLAEYFVKYYDKRFVLYWASAFKHIIDNYAQSSIMKPDISFERFKRTQFMHVFKELENSIKDPKLPKLSKEYLNKFKKEGKSHLRRAMMYVDFYNTISDYVSATNQNLQNKDFEEAYREAVEWHNNLKATGKTIDLEGDMELIHKFEDGYYWVDNHSSDCEIEGDAMGHCGRTRADTILSLRSPDGEPHISVSFNYDDNTYTQAKGKENKKPVEKYHKYMEWLFTNDGKYQIKGYRPEYQESQDFKLEDLPEDIQKDVLEKYPQYDPKRLLKKLLESNISPEGKVSELMKLSKDNDDDIYEFDDIKYSDDFGMFYINTPEDKTPIEEWANSKDDKLKFWIEQLEEGFIDVDTSHVEIEDFLKYNLADEFDIDHESIKTLLKLAREEDEDTYFEVMASVEDDTDVVEIFTELYDKDEFDNFKRAMDTLIRYSYETTAYDDVYKDVSNFLESVTLEHATVMDYEVELYFDKIPMYEVIQDYKYYIGGTIDTLINMAVNCPETVHFHDYINEFSFEDKFESSPYGYPKGGADKEVVSDYLTQIEELIL